MAAPGNINTTVYFTGVDARPAGSGSNQSNSNRRRRQREQIKYRYFRKSKDISTNLFGAVNAGHLLKTPAISKPYLLVEELI
jgi:hypothetical protein